MTLHIRHGKARYEVQVPPGSRVHSSSTGCPVLIIPGPRPQDTATWVHAAEVVDAARLGLFGMALRRERQPVACH